MERTIAAFNPTLNDSQGITSVKDLRTPMALFRASPKDAREKMTSSMSLTQIKRKQISSLQFNDSILDSDVPGLEIDTTHKRTHSALSHSNSPSPIELQDWIESSKKNRDSEDDTRNHTRRAKVPSPKSESIDHLKTNPENLLKQIGRLFNENNEQQILKALEYLAFGIEEYTDNLGVCL